MDKILRQAIRARKTQIREADKSYALAEEHRGKSRHQQAAKQYEQAANLYRICGLGLLAKNAYVSAAVAYEHIENENGTERCGMRARAVPVYWDESHHDVKWG